jgi:hypothetical protein
VNSTSLYCEAPIRRVAVIATLIASFAAGTILLRVSTRASAREWVTTWSGTARPFVEQGIYGSARPRPEFRDAYEHGVLRDQTIRIAVRSTVSGSRSRIFLSNQYGKQPLTIGAARIAKLVSKNTDWRDPVFSWGYSPVPETEQEILFGGKTSIVIPPGGVVRSDAVTF